MKIQAVLCGIDFSEHSQRALRYGLALANVANGALYVAFVNAPLISDAPHVVYDVEALKTQTERELTEFVQRTAPAGAESGINLTPLVGTGRPDHELLRLGGHESVDLIVIGSHGTGGYRTTVLGSTAARVLRQTQVPVLVVPPTTLSTVALASERPAIHPGTILVPVDFSDATENLVDAAVELAQMFDARLILMHVLTPVELTPAWQGQLPVQDRIRRGQANEHLERLAREIDLPSAPEVILTAGRPADQIPAIANQRRIGLIVIGLREDSGAHGGHIGNVASRLLAQAPAPVLALPNRGPTEAA